MNTTAITPKWTAAKSVAGNTEYTNSPHIYVGRVGYWGNLAVGRIDGKPQFINLHSCSY